MADTYTPEEIQRIFDEYNAAIKNGGTASVALTKEFKDATKGIKNYTDNLNASLKQLGKSGFSFGRSIKDGKKGFSAYNDALSSTADVVSNVASQFGLLGAIFGAAIKAGAEYAKAVNKQADALHDAYQEMGKIGVTGSAGMTGVFTNMQKFGYGIEQLGAMSDLLRDNASDLAAIGGTAQEGTKRFADLAESIQRSTDQVKFREMGMSIDSINKGAASYMRQQAAIGRGKEMTNDQLRDGTVAYVRELDALRKLTGQSQEQQEALLDQAMQEQAFNQTIYELEKQAADGDEDAASQVKKLKEIMLSNLPNDIKDQLKRSIGGDFGAAEKLAKVAPDALRMAMDKKASVGQTMDAFRDGIKKNQDLRGSQAKLNTYNEDYGDISEQRKFLASMGDKHYDDIKDQAVQQQDVHDDLAKNAVKIETEQLNVRDNLQSLLQKGIEPVTKAIAGLSNIVAKGTTGVGKAVGAEPAGGAGPLAPPTKGKPPAEATPGPTISGMDDVKKMIIAHEGIKTRPYKDTKGLWTVGVGHLIGDGKTLPPDMNREFSMKEVMDMFESDFVHHVKLAEQTPGYNKANEKGKGALIDLAYNMGKWWTKFPTTAKALEAGDFKAAAAGLQDSAWYKQVGQRGPQIVAMVASGGKDKGYKDGGMPTGPNSGYQTTLHGTEAVVPMKENNKMPIDMQKMTEGLQARSALFEKNLAKIGDIIRIASHQVDVSQKIFSSAH